jgi:hypothetical protein
MMPTFRPGSVLVGAATYLLKPKVGLPVVIKTNRRMLKRVKKINNQGLWVEGDNQASNDSRHFGYIKPRNIQAVIFMRLR